MQDMLFSCGKTVCYIKESSSRPPSKSILAEKVFQFVNDPQGANPASAEIKYNMKDMKVVFAAELNSFSYVFG
jgi:hypothetical protein